MSNGLRFLSVYDSEVTRKGNSCKKRLNPLQDRLVGAIKEELLLLLWVKLTINLSSWWESLLIRRSFKICFFFLSFYHRKLSDTKAAKFARSFSWIYSINFSY